VIGGVEPGPAYEEGAYPPYYGDAGIGYGGYGYGGYRHRGLGYRGLGYRGYRGLGHRGWGYRGRVGFHGRVGFRGGLGYRGGFRGGMRVAGPRIGMPYHPRMMGPRHMSPGVVHPMHGPRRHP
jgi:hypothetical protein